MQMAPQSGIQVLGITLKIIQQWVIYKIRMFAANALTTPEILQSTYLDYIYREATLRDSKKKMRKSNYSLIKGVQAN